jgi:hypothetical protein
MSSSSLAAQDELLTRLSQSGTDWFYTTGVGRDGGRFGYASDTFPAQDPNTLVNVRKFFFYDIHSSLGGWWLSHLWRAADLAEVASVCLANWQVLPAAACARALVEGVAAFVIEGEQMLDEWSAFKHIGVPSLDAVFEFRERFNGKLLQAQLGSRLGEHDGVRPPALKRTNVLTLLEKFSKRVGGNVMPSYEWLCDAVHPSYGFQTAYVATQGVHRARSTIAADLARRTDAAKTNLQKVEPTVAWAAADLLIVSVDALLAEVPRVRWLIDDFGLTTGVAFCALEHSIGRTGKRNKKTNCPCGSGLQFGACRHEWGDRAMPPGIAAE